MMLHSITLPDILNARRVVCRADPNEPAHQDGLPFFGRKIAYSKAEGPMRYLDLLNDYRTALGLWSEVRFLYSSAAPEVVAATLHLKALEDELRLYDKQPALAA